MERYPNRGSITVRGMLVPIPSFYTGEAITASFPVSYEKVDKIINSKKIKPVKFTPTTTLLSITIFDFQKTPVGPYKELVYAIPVLHNSRIQIPILQLLFKDYLNNFGFFVLDIAQSTEIALEHGDLLTGYPHNKKYLVDTDFSRTKESLCVKVTGDMQEILSLSCSMPKKTMDGTHSYMTYFEKGQRLHRIQMDIHGMEQKISSCRVHLGPHPLARVIRGLDVSEKSIQTRYYPQVTEVNPVNVAEI